MSRVRLTNRRQADGDVDPFSSRVRSLRKDMSQLNSVRRKKLNQFGVGVIRPNDSVESLINVLEQVIAEV